MIELTRDPARRNEPRELCYHQSRIGTVRATSEEERQNGYTLRIANFGLMAGDVKQSQPELCGIDYCGKRKKTGSRRDSHLGSA